MQHRHHLFIDSLGQISILLFFSFLYGFKNDSITILKLLPLLLCLWQIINGIISYKFFERQSKKLFVKISGVSVATIFAINGIFWFANKTVSLSLYFYSLTENFNYFFEVITVVLCAVFCLWYFYLTTKDVYIILFKTV